jgi:hypothetical protein
MLQVPHIPPSYLHQNGLSRTCTLQRTIFSPYIRSVHEDPAPSFDLAPVLVKRTKKQQGKMASGIAVSLFYLLMSVFVSFIIIIIIIIAVCL